MARTRRAANAPLPSAQQRYTDAVAAYVAAGGEESVQRVITAVQSLNRKLDQWYDRQLADLDISHGEWGVLTHLATSGDAPVTPTQLADATNVAPSSMTHRLDRMGERGLLERTPDPGNRTRMLVTLTDQGWQLFVESIRESNVVETDILGGLTAQQREQLADLLEVVISGLDRPEAT